MEKVQGCRVKNPAKKKGQKGRLGRGDIDPKLTQRRKNGSERKIDTQGGGIVTWVYGKESIPI